MKDSKKQTILFLHIPKTAGNTLYRIIERQYRAKNIYTVWSDGSLDTFKNLSDSQKSSVRLLRGHFGFGLHHYLPGPINYFTILREPIERTISYYHFIRRTPQHYCYDLITDNNMNLEDFINSKSDKMVDNAQTRLLSGMESGHEVAFGECTEETLAAAKKNLREYFKVIGLTEEFDKTLLLLKKTFGWRNIFYTRQNVTPHTFKEKTIAISTLNTIKNVNLLDIDLYQYAKQVFKEQLLKQNIDLSKEEAKFKIINRRLKPITYISWEMRKISLRALVRKKLDSLID